MHDLETLDRDSNNLFVLGKSQSLAHAEKTFDNTEGSEKLQLTPDNTDAGDIKVFETKTTDKVKNLFELSMLSMKKNNPIT